MTKQQSIPDPLKKGLLFLYVETPLHVGCGEGLGAIDLPLQRERMSDLPVVPGSGLKGALREAFRNSDTEIDLFGPRPPDPKQSAASREPPDHAGALSVTDAKLLLLPIRTVYGGWAWATSPMILERLAREHVVAGRGDPTWAAQLMAAARTLVDKIDNDAQALVFKNNPTIAPNHKLILEDTLYTAKAAPEAPANALCELLRSALPPCRTYQPIRDRIADQLVLLSDTELKFWAKHGTEITTRVRINENTGTVADGALWTEESLPAESLLWSVALISDSRKPNNNSNGATLMQHFANTLEAKSRIFLGGDRTIGRGLCGVNLIQGGLRS